MYCPSCKAEFRPGIARCTDCDVDLVDALIEIPADAFSKGNLILLWAGDDLSLHASLLEELKAAGIPYFDRPLALIREEHFLTDFQVQARRCLDLKLQCCRPIWRWRKQFCKKSGTTPELELGISV